MQDDLINKTLSNYSVFYQKVWKITATIPCGETRSYQWVSSKTGNPSSSRAVGRALSENPLPGVIPCHRVIRKNGDAGNYFMGSKLKESLIVRESGSPLGITEKKEEEEKT